MKFTCRHCSAEVQADWQYCLACGKKLPMKTNQKAVRTEIAMAESRRQGWASLQQKREFVSGVQILSTNDLRTCDTCRADCGRFVSLNEPMPLPHQQCKCDPWCRCTTISVLKDEGTRLSFQKLQRDYWNFCLHHLEYFCGARLAAKPNCCEVCLAADGKFYDFGTPPPLPHSGCRCIGGCGCAILPVPRPADDSEPKSKPKSLQVTLGGSRGMMTGQQPEIDN